MAYGEIHGDVRLEMMLAVAGLPVTALGNTFDASLLQAGVELSGGGYSRATVPSGALYSAAWTRSGTTATVTTTDVHGLVDGQEVEVTDSSDVAAVTNGTKTPITVLTSTTFTFTCLNAGATSGTLTLQPTPFWDRDVDSETGDVTLVQAYDIVFPAASGANWTYNELRLHPPGLTGVWLYRFPATVESQVLAGNVLTIPAGTLRIPDLSRSLA